MEVTTRPRAKRQPRARISQLRALGATPRSEHATARP